jgi:hypothetical protein
MQLKQERIMSNDTHFLELIRHWKQHPDDNTFRSVEAWYDRYYAPNALKHVYDVLCIWTHYMERHQLISMSRVIDELKPGQFYYPHFPDLTDEQNAQFGFRLLAIYLSQLRNTKVVNIPGYQEYIDSLKV